MRRAAVIVTILVGAIGGMVLWMLARETGPERQQRAASESTLAPDVVELLQRVRRAWNPFTRARIIEAKRGDAKRMAPALAAVLQSPEDPLLEPAIEVVEALELVELAPILRELVDTASSRLKSTAVRAVDLLAPFSIDDLSDLLVHADPDVRTAVLTRCALREQRPLEAIVELLVDSDPLVREAALAALPEQLGPDHVGQVLELARRGDEPTAQVIGALGLSVGDSRVEEYLYERLQGHDPATRIAALSALAEKGSVLSRPEFVRWVIRDSERPLGERARAIECIERTRTFGSLDMLTDLWPTHSVLEHFAARCLISAGDKRGVDKLLDIVESGRESFVGVSDRLVDEVLLASKRLLCEISGTGLYSGIEVWRESLASRPTLRPRVLERSAVNLDSVDAAPEATATPSSR